MNRGISPCLIVTSWRAAGVIDGEHLAVKRIFLVSRARARGQERGTENDEVEGRAHEIVRGRTAVVRGEGHPGNSTG
jgi:hypothetical protein